MELMRNLSRRYSNKVLSVPEQIQIWRRRLGTSMLHQTESGLSIIFNIQLNNNNNNKRKTKKDNKAAFGSFTWNSRTCPVPED